MENTKRRNFNISLIYSIISSFLIYKNPNGITLPIFAIL